MPLNEQPSATDEETRVADDARIVYEMIVGQSVSMTVSAAAELGVLDVLAEKSLTAAEIASATGCDASAMQRLLVACASLGLLGEDASGAFQATPRGTLLAERTPGSLRALARVQRAPGGMALWGALPDAVREGRPQATALLGEDFFSFLSSHPEEGALFAASMRDLTGLVVEDARRIVDFGGACDVLDVGGGDGSFLLGLLDAHPEVRGRVLERAQEAELARAAGARTNVGSRFAVVEGDFFEAVPPADYYLLKLILHDWNDEQCRQVLANCRASARPDSRLLVVEALIGEATADDDSLDLGALMDMTILRLLPGRERRLSEYEDLLTSTGWRPDRVVATRSLYSLIEAVAASTA